MIVKVCGMRDAENIRQVDALGVDWMGFIFYSRSKRYVATLPAVMPIKSRRVGVFVNASIEEISRRIKEFRLHAVQLHGSESRELCADVRQLGVEVIKAIHVSRPLPPTDYPADYLLFETPSDAYGGSGHHFDWTILDEYMGPIPFLLSGGIGPDDVNKIKQIKHPYFAGIDLNSKVEISPGLKDPEAINTVILKLTNESD